LEGWRREAREHRWTTIRRVAVVLGPTVTGTTVIFDVACKPSQWGELWVLLCCHSGRQFEVEFFERREDALAAMRHAQGTGNDP
jgi:hypothetical protein